MIKQLTILLVLMVILAIFAVSSETSLAGDFWDLMSLKRSEIRENINYEVEFQTLSDAFLVAHQMPALIKDIYPNLTRYCPYNHGEDYCAVVVTAYSSTPDQTDSTPFITASGAHVRDGIIACNFLPFGAKIRFPEIYGDKVFIVEDRLAWKNRHKMDIWFSSRWEALAFGIKKTTFQILE